MKIVAIIYALTILVVGFLAMTSSGCAKPTESTGPSVCQRQLELCHLELQTCRHKTP